MRGTLGERLFAKLEIVTLDGCWLWTGATNGSGYGTIGTDTIEGKGRVSLVHRIAYELSTGEIPPDRVIDHACHTSACQLGIDCPHRRCCNPAHLSPRTNAENLARQSPHSPRTKPAHCKRQHPFTPENTYVDPRGYWQCRTCRREALRELRAR